MQWQGTGRVDSFQHFGQELDRFYVESEWAAHKAVSVVPPFLGNLDKFIDDVMLYIVKYYTCLGHKSLESGKNLNME